MVRAELRRQNRIDPARLNYGEDPRLEFSFVDGLRTRGDEMLADASVESIDEEPSAEDLAAAERDV